MFFLGSKETFQTSLRSNANAVSMLLAAEEDVNRKSFFFVEGGAVLTSATLMETSGDVEICLESAAGTGSSPFLLVLCAAVNLSRGEEENLRSFLSASVFCRFCFMCAFM